VDRRRDTEDSALASGTLKVALRDPGSSAADPGVSILPALSKGTTEQGYRNRNGQVVIRPTHLAVTDHYQYVYVLRCGRCGHGMGPTGPTSSRAVPELPGRRSGALGTVVSRFIPPQPLP
jgi:hypothetical protein